jgi:CheY-like chemotaxis protein
MARQLNAQEEETAGTILLVEDDEGTRKVLEMVIETETPYKALTFENEQETLHHIEQVIEARPILFILDYHLPTMTAIDLYDRLHSHKELEQQPAIILTALNRNEHREQAAAERHIEVVSKPFDLEELLRCIEQALQRCFERT